MTNSTRRRPPKPLMPHRHRRANKPGYDPLTTRANLVSDEMWERAGRLMDVIAPETPFDAVPMDPKDVWAILEIVAVNLPTGYWEDPAALEDLYKLRKQFAPQMPGTETLPILAKAARASQKARPDPSITPQNPEYDKMIKRMGVGAK